MNRLYISGTAFGIFLATSVFTAYYLFTDKPVDKTEPITSKDAKRILIDEGYHILSANEWKDNQTNLLTLNKQRGENRQSHTNDNAAITLSIKSGMSSNEIINLLKEKKVIQDKHEFSVYLDHQDLTKKIQIGTYTVYKNMDYAALAAVLTKGR